MKTVAISNLSGIPSIVMLPAERMPLLLRFARNIFYVLRTALSKNKAAMLEKAA
jgi:hypothetical protein